MTDQDPTGQSEHERRVEEEQERAGGRTERGGLVGGTEEADAEMSPTPYEREIEAEKRGERRDEVDAEVEEDERNPLDAGYRPRSG